jgi:hypothetical protein
MSALFKGPKINYKKPKEVEQPDIIDEEKSAMNAAEEMRKRARKQGRQSTNLSGGGDYSGTILG